MAGNRAAIWVLLTGVLLQATETANVVPYLLFANTVDIRRINLDATNYRYVVQGLNNVVGIDFDLNKNEVYWSDVSRKKIQKQPINGGTITDIITDKLGTPEGIAIDWKARKLYWTDTGLNTIDTADLDGSNRKTLVSVGLDQPRAIVLDPANNWMYWSDWGVIAKIEKARMSDASQRQTIVRGSLYWPNALAIDYEENKLYWADAWYRKIEKSDLYGKGRTTLINQVNVYSPYHMTQYLKRIYWTDWRQRTIEHGDKNTGLDRVSIAGSMTRPTAIHVVHPDRQPSGTNECLQLNGGCDHNCVDTIATYYCTCKTGYSLSSDKHACIDNNECSTGHGGCNQVCTNTPGSFKCSCLTGYKLSSDGRTCVDTDECSVNNGGCSFKCTNTPSSHYCSCRTGYELNSDQKTCKDKNECSSSTTNSCPSDATCKNLAGSYTCVCATGKHYDLVSKTCKDYDECKTSDNKCQQKCANTDGSYTCSCLTGYQLNVDKLTCSDVDECAQNKGGCQQSCLNTAGSFSCSCSQKGYQLNTDKKSCSLVNCGSPSHITGFKTTCDGTATQYRYAKKCTLSCTAGTLFGDSFIECLDSGRWSAPNSGCRGASTVPNRAPTDISLGTASVPENSAVGTIVGPLSSTDLDSGQTHSYTLLDNANGAFALNTKTNTITVNKVLDYETKSSYTIKVNSTDNGNPAMSLVKTLTITLTDVNEAPSTPKITKNTVNENSPNQTVVGTLSAVDVDKPAQTLTFTLLSNDRDHFVLGGTAKNQLLVKRNTLDFEATPKTHQVTVHVVDSGSPPLTSSAIITITLIDQNDPPTDISLSGVSVKEYANGANGGARSGTVIGKLSTTDQDAKDTHTYSLEDSANRKVKISGSNVVVDVASGINYETVQSFKITVKTTDKAGATFTKDFLITVTNVNESPTAVLISNNDVLEHSPVGTVVGTITAQDQDYGDTHSFSLVSNPGRYFRVAGSTLKVDSSNLDHEIASSVNILVKATDKGGLSVTSTISIKVNDRNEAPNNISLTPAIGKTCQSPTPPQRAGDVCVPENVPAGELVGTLSAIDVDGDSVAFSLIDSTGFFNLSGAKILVSRPGLDYESPLLGSVVTLSITATDSSGLVKLKNFNIEILDQNDPPTNIELSNRVVRESTVAGTPFATFSAQDQDNNKLTFTLANDDSGRFGLSGSQLVVKKTLNHETTAKHIISVKCSDGLATVGPQSFTIEIQDDNDSPINITMNATAIEENRPLGTVIGSVLATDEDENETLTFQLDDNAGGRFGLDEDSANGQWLLRSRMPFDYEEQTSYVVIVRVSDSKGETNFRVFTIDVIDVNESPENLVLHHSEVFENQPSGTLVGIVTASDPEGKPTQFKIERDPAGVFKLENVLDSTTHDAQALKTTKALDYETERSYVLDISASDGTATPTVRRFQVSVMNQNEAPSAISLDSFTVDENSPLRSRIANITVSDPDALLVAQTYQCRLLDNAGGRLAVDKLELVVSGSINYEETSKLSVYIECEDQGGLSVSSLFSIAVVDRDDPPTYIESRSGRFQVFENLPPGRVVTALTTTDEDLWDNFTYSVSPNSAPFRASGEFLVTTRPLNFESRSSYALSLTSTDTSGASVTRQVVVHVQDSNDKPRAVTVLNSVSVLENTPTGTLITTLRTVDDDVDQTYNYSLVSKAGAVSILSDGRVVVSDSKLLNYEISQSIHFVVKSTDSGFGNLSVTQVLIIPVVDVNEPPSDILIPRLSVLENSAGGTSVSVVQVSDPDQFSQSFHCLLKEDAEGRFQVIGGGITSQPIELYVGYNGSDINYEKDKSFHILVDCLDNGGLSLTKAFTVSVTDANDAPYDVLFSQTKLASQQVVIEAKQQNVLTTPSVSVEENSSYGDIVGFLYVIDEDTSGQTHACRFNNKPPVLGIHSKTTAGIVIVVEGQLDYESVSQYRLQVTCTDSGNPPMNVSRNVTVNIRDVTEPPVAITLFPETVKENRPSGTLIGALGCVDHDMRAVQPNYLYTIVSLGARFAMLGDNQLVSTEPLDFEQTPNVSVQVKVTKVHSPPLTYQQTIIIQVVDVNEPATDLFVDRNQKTVTVNETADLGSVVGRLSLDDPDNNDQFTYQVVSGSNGTFVTSDDDLEVAGTLDAWSQDIYNVVIQGTDAAGHSLQTVINIVVQEVDACTRNNGGCDRNAQCSRAGPGRAACKCLPGFVGDGFSCEDKDDCTPDPCSPENTDFNSGKCQNGYGGVLNFSCPCKVGWGQPDCTTEANECASNPCNPSGTDTCSDLFNGYLCECLHGWTGSRCETDVDDCLTEEEPCHGHGTCIDMVGGYTCNCEDPYIGVGCDTDDSVCRGSESVCPLNRNATCVSHPPDNAQRYSCICDVPFSVDCTGCAEGYEEDETGYCKDVNECLSDDTCLNRGVCTNTAGEFLCNCTNPWVGYKCQFHSQQEAVKGGSGSSSSGTVTAMGVSIVVLVCMIVIMAFLWYRHRNLRRIVYKGDRAAFSKRGETVEVSPQFQEMMDNAGERGNQEFTNPTFDLDDEHPSGLEGITLDNPVYETSSPVGENPMYEPVTELMGGGSVGAYSNPVYSGAMSSFKGGLRWKNRPSSMARFDQG